MSFYKRTGASSGRRHGWPTPQPNSVRSGQRPAQPAPADAEAAPSSAPLFDLPGGKASGSQASERAAQPPIDLTAEHASRNSRGILSNKQPDTVTGDTLQDEIHNSLQESGLLHEEDLGNEDAVMDDAPNARDRTNNFDPHVVWQMVLSELALQMPPATYDTWVRDTVVIGYEDGEFIIGMPNAYARDWLENRLRHTIKRTLNSIMRRSVQLQFRVRPRPVQDQTQAAAAPLYQAVVEEPVVTNSANQAHEPLSVTQSPANKKAADSMPTGHAPTGEPHLPDDPIHEPTRGNARAVEMGAAEPGAANGPAANNDTQSGTPRTTQLNPYHTFETFVVGSHNRLAHAAALAIVDAPGQTFNPLFIYGGVGLGKTHLLNAIGNSVRQKGYKMLYCSSEQFTNDLISAIRNQSTEQFRNKYRQVDVLLIDDIQFIGGKESTQEEFFHTFNHLHAAGRQLVLTSDRPPKAIATLEERLRSRFEGGLQTDIAQPDFETRVAILQSKANRIGAAVPQDVLMLVAERVDSNIRELEGALNRLVMQARLTNQTLNLGLARTLLDNLAPQRLPCAPREVIRIVAEHFSLRPEDLTGRKRTKEIASARQIAMYLLREENDLSLPAIGDHLGGRDHSTVRYGVERVTEELDRDESLRMVILTLRDKVYAPPAS